MRQFNEALRVKKLTDAGAALLPEFTHKDMRRNEDRQDRVLELSTRHIHICKLHCQGLTNVEVGEVFGITPQNVSDVINSEKGKELISAINSCAVGSIVEEDSSLNDIVRNAQAIVGEVLDPSNLERGNLPLAFIVKTALEVVKKTIPSTVNLNKSTDVELSARMIDRVKERSSLAAAVRQQAIEEANYNEI